MELVLDVPFDDRYEYFCNYDPTCSYLCNAMRVADAYRHCHAIALNTARVLAMRVHCTTKTVQVYRLFAAWYQSLWHICTATGECFVLVSTKQGLIWGYAAISCWEWTDDMYEEGLVPAAFLVQTSQYSLLLLQLERHATLQHLNHVPVFDLGSFGPQRPGPTHAGAHQSRNGKEYHGTNPFFSTPAKLLKETQKAAGKYQKDQEKGAVTTTSGSAE
eukprot:1616741-Rhodomonas_salina.1